MNATQEQEFEKQWDIWLATYADRGVLYKAKDANGRWSFVALPEICKLAKAYCELYNAGYASLSVFSIVVDLMLQDGDLAVVRDDESESRIPADIRDFIEKAERGEISTYELRKKYTTDRRFKDAYDRFSGWTSTASTPVVITAEDYKRIPSAVAQRRYQQEPAFRAAVDVLHASGRV